MFGNAYQGKKVLITGHTGFKGSWLVTWLLRLNADIVGISSGIPTQPSMFEALRLEKHIKHITADIRDLEKVRALIQEEAPDFIFHLAAQAIVSSSYQEPIDTITTNIVGTANLLESLRCLQKSCNAVIITSDKCYHNKEWFWGYRETDELGGKDIYSGSKAGAELVIQSYLHSFFQNNHPVRLAIGRAGNVIGGGDWAKDRIVADCMRAWDASKSVEIRCPTATRPWQHVLEPLSGYLLLGQRLSEMRTLHGEAFNFGPKSDQTRTVLELLMDLNRVTGLRALEEAYTITDSIPFNEASLLKLSCDKAYGLLRWEPNLEYDETIQFVGEWYENFYRTKKDSFLYTDSQIGHYEELALGHRRAWIK